MEAGIETMLNAQGGHRGDRHPQSAAALTLPEWSRGGKTEPRDSEMAVQVWKGKSRKAEGAPEFRSDFLGTRDFHSGQRRSVGKMNTWRGTVGWSHQGQEDNFPQVLWSLC